MKNKLFQNLKTIVSYSLALLVVVSSFGFVPTVQAVGMPTVTISSQSASNGNAINVPINASNFANTVAGMDFTVQYDPTLLTYTGLTQNAISGHGTLTTGTSINSVIINWFDSSALAIDSGAILTLNFTVISATTTNANLTFLGTKELNNSSADSISSSFVDGVITLNPINPDIAFVAADKAALVDGLIQGTNIDLANIITTLTNPLPVSGSNGSAITWASSNTTVVSNDGQTVVRPAFGAGNATVTLTATLTKGVVTDTKIFLLTVLAETVNPDIALVAADKAALVDGLIQGTNIDLANITVALNTLPAVSSVNASTITWSSNSPLVVSNDGQTVVRPAFGAGNATVTLTATLTKGVVSDTKVFTLTVLKLPASTVATITSATYTVSAGGTSSETITNIPFGTSKTTFLAALTKGEASQTWNDTGIADPVVSSNTLVVTAQDGLTTIAYTVTVLPNFAKTITAFSFVEGMGVINESAKTVAVTVPFATDITTLIPTITITGASVSPASGVAQDFTNPVVYTVTAEDSTTQTYLVTVTSILNSAKEITSFSFAEGSGVITETNIAVTVPFGTDITALIPTITITGDSVSPLSGIANNFTTPQTYTVTAADSSTKTYTITVTVAPNTVANILSFNSTAPVANGVIAGNNITLTVPFGTSLVDLPIAITLSTGASVLPTAGSTTFVDGVATTYTVTAQDGVTTNDYSVTVNIAANTAKDITSFDFNGLTPNISGVISGNNITLNVPYGTNVTALVPTVGITGASVSPASEVTQDFTSSVTYTVTAADSSTQDYTVTVIVASPSDLTALITAIATAQSKYDVAVEGNIPGQYPAPLKANLQTAINTASAITNVSAQSVVDAAVVTLNSAVATFEAGVVPAPSTVALATAITSAQTLHDSAVEGMDPGQYAVGSKIILQNAINAAITVKNDLSSIQANVDAAVITLNSAVATFESGKVPALVILNSIAITTPATKLSYTVGDSLSIAGLVVTGTYSDASTKVETITTASITGFNSSVPATGQVLTITVGSKTTTYAINIVATSGGGGGGGGGGGTYVPPVIIKPGDANKDGKVDKYDFALMMANWGKTGTNVCDFNNDGKVDKYDFALLMSKWGL